MLSTLRTLLVRDAATGNEGSDEETLVTATAVLLMEIARADLDVSDDERAVIRRLLERQHGVSPELAGEIARHAEERVGHETSLHPFTRLLNQECSLDERIRIVSMLWEVTFADGCADAHEEHLVRRVAGLLHVPHREFIRTKLGKSQD